MRNAPGATPPGASQREKTTIFRSSSQFCTIKPDDFAPVLLASTQQFFRQRQTFFLGGHMTLHRGSRFIRFVRAWSILSVVGMIAACGGQHGETLSLSEAGSHPDDADLHPAWARARVLPYGHLATGRSSMGTSGLKETPRAPWPFAVLSIGHTSASYQNYGGSPYFHHGLDIRGDAGTPVLASVGGTVVNIENYMPGSAYWEVAILDDQGFIWQYHHIDHDSIPQAIHLAFKNGGSVAAGEKLGEIFYWQVSSFGERFHHVHLNILGADMKFQNPFLFLDVLPDTSPPAIVNIGLTQKGNQVTGNTVKGPYGLFAKVHDLILHQKFVVPANSLTVSVDEAPAFTVWNFDDGLPGGASEDDFVNNFFVPSLTCGNYSCRELSVNLGFSKTGSRVFPLTSGPHKATVTASDAFGNQAEKTYSWTVE